MMDWIKKALMATGALAIGLMALGALFGGDEMPAAPMTMDMGAYANPYMQGMNQGMAYSDDSYGYNQDWDAQATPEYQNYDQGSYQANPNAYYDNQGTYEYNTRWGGGSQSSDGSWNHHSNLAGGSVGGTSDGCVYTSVAGGWSNC